MKNTGTGYVHTGIMYFLFILLMLFVGQGARADSQTRLSVKAGVPLEVSPRQGVAAAFSGVLDGNVIVAGGANFPNVPVCKGGQKHFYSDIYQLDASSTNDSRPADDRLWSRVGQLPHPAAHGASVTTSEGIVCVGGTDGGTTFRDAYILHVQHGKKEEQTKVVCEALPDLPVGVQQHALAADGETVYLLGGTTDEGPNCKVYALTPYKDRSWRVVAELPSKSRLQPVATVQHGATTQCLFVFGGFTDEEGRAEVLTDGLCMNLLTYEWSKTASVPDGLNVTGGTCANSGYSHVLFVGGFDKRVFEARCNDEHPDSTYFLHPASWYRFNDKVLVYHTITNRWFTLQSNERFARSGSSLVKTDDGGWMYVDGEVRPGDRSTDVTSLSIEHQVSFGCLNWTVLVIYLLAMLALGYYFMKREGGADDFFKGGGRIPWWAAGISIYATMLSALTYMSIPAKAYATNWIYYVILLTIVPISWPVIHYYLPYFRRLNITSAYEYLEMRFNLSTRLLASGLFIVFMVARMALVLFLPSLALNAVTGINVQLCIILMGVVTIIYCTMGGVEAVVWGDVVQGIILVGGAFFAAAFLIWNTDGGLNGFFNIATENDKFRLVEWSLDYRSVTFWVAIIGGLANNLISYTSDQTVIQRYLTTKDERSAAQSIKMNAFMCVFISVVFYVIGTGLYTFFYSHPEQLDITMAKGDAIFPFFMMSQMPAGVAGLLIAAIFAATMSTISSNINSIATAYSVDFYKRFRPQTSDSRMLRVARNTCLLSGVIGVGIALLMASWDILSLIDYFNSILGLLTGGLGGLFFMGVFVKRIKGRAALIGFMCGTLFVFWLQYCTDANLFLYGASGIAVSVVVAWLLSFLPAFKKA